MIRKISKKRVAVYIAIIVVAVFAAAEIAVRIAVPYRINIDSEQKYWALWSHTNAFGQYNKDDDLEFDGLKVSMQKAPGEKRVICLGSSSTYGAGLQDRRMAYPQVLNRMIPEALVLNGGWGGYNSYQLWIYLSEVLVLVAPDVVVFYYGGNECYGHSAKSFYPRAKDIVARMRSRGSQHFVDLQDAVAFGTSNPVALEALYLLSDSRLFLYIRDAIIRSRYNNDLKSFKYETTADCLTMTQPTTEMILRDMVDLSVEKNFQLIFVSEISSSARHANRAIFDLMNGFCKTGPVKCVNVLDAMNFKNDPGLFIDTSHLTPKGHQKMADLLEPEIRGMLGLTDVQVNEGISPISAQAD